MTAPARLLSNASQGGADAEARKLLSSALDVGPPAGAQAAIWAGLEAALGAPTPGGGGSSGGSSGANGSVPGGGLPGGAPAAGAATPLATTGAAIGMKVTVAAFVACVAVGAALFTRPGPAPSVGDAGFAMDQADTGAPPAELLGAAPSVRPGVIAGPMGSLVAEPELHDRDVAHLPSSHGAVVPAGVSSAGGTASLLKREAEGLRRARTELASGNGRAALVVLGEIDRDVPRGILGQERALVAIEALAATGQTAQARQRAEAFLAAHPDSPHAERIRPFLGRRSGE